MPWLPAKVSVLPVLMLPVPVVPDKLMVLLGMLMLAELKLLMRPYMSVVMMGILLELPTVVAPGPAGVKLIAVLLTVTLPPPALVMVPVQGAPLDQ
jgi:hypothetical protein